MKIPIGRTTTMSFYSPGGERPQVLHGTWLEAEAFSYPAGGFTRKAYVELRKNEHNPVELPYGQKRVVACSVPDTYFSIPARFRFRGETVKGFISVQDADTEQARFTFTPEAAHRYEVVVGNVGTVYSGPSETDARATMATYVEQSKSGRGRAGGEDVTLLRDDDVIAEHVGNLHDWEDRDGDE